MLNSFVNWIQRKVFWGILRHWVSDRKYAEYRYRLEQDYKLDLQNPQRFTEKIQWIKLYERTELRKKVADRLRVRDYVSKKIGEDHLVPLIDSFEELTPKIWKSLPEQFVLKANHGCGMIQIIRDKTSACFDDVKKKSEVWRQTEYFNVGREWVYKNLPRTILAEKLLTDENGNIPSDYKFFCFHGRVEIIQIDIDRFGEQKRNLYDRDFQQLNCRLLYPKYEGKITEHKMLSEAIKIAENLSDEFSFLRVDLYLVDDQIFFGELTNYPGNGFIEFEPESTERWVGSLLTLQ